MQTDSKTECETVRSRVSMKNEMETDRKNKNKRTAQTEYIFWNN